MPTIYINPYIHGGTADWWVVAGKTCVAAYQPIGAASLAASYTNLANPGTYDAAPGVAPTHASATGWTGGGSAYLTTGVIPTSGAWTALIRYTNAALNEWPLGSYNNAVTTNYYAFRPITALGLGFFWGPTSGAVVPGLAHGVIGLAGNQPYRNGSPDGAALAGTWTGVATTIFVLARSLAGDTPNGYFTGSVQAVAIYSDTLSGAEVAILSAAMAALT